MSKPTAIMVTLKMGPHLLPVSQILAAQMDTRKETPEYNLQIHLDGERKCIPISKEQWVALGDAFKLISFGRHVHEPEEKDEDGGNTGKTRRRKSGSRSGASGRVLELKPARGRKR